MRTKPYTDSKYVKNTVEVYVNGKYAGLASVATIPVLQRLESSLKRSAALRQALGDVMVCPQPYRPIGGQAISCAASRWLLTHGAFPNTVWVDGVHGVWWSPTAWTMTMIICKAKGHEFNRY